MALAGRDPQDKTVASEKGYSYRIMIRCCGIFLMCPGFWFLVTAFQYLGGKTAQESLTI